SPRTDRALAGPSPGPTLALRLLSVDLHLARTHPLPRLRPTEGPLRSAAEQRRCGVAETGLGPQVCGRTTGDAGCLAHLDARHALSSSRPSVGQRRGTFPRRPTVGCGPPSRLPGSRLCLE